MVVFFLAISSYTTFGQTICRIFQVRPNSGGEGQTFQQKRVPITNSVEASSLDFHIRLSSRGCFFFSYLSAHRLVVV